MERGLWLHRGVLNGLVAGREGHLVSQYPPGIVILDAVPFLAGRALDRGLSVEPLRLESTQREAADLSFTAERAQG